MKKRVKATRRLRSGEVLEPRLALAVTVTNPLPDITVPFAATSQTISVGGSFDDTAVTGTVLQFNTNSAAPADRVFVELFDQAGPGRSRTTPATVANFLSYVDDGSYANTIIHRSVPGFVVQGGGFRAPTVPSNQTGGSPASIATKPAVVNEPGNTNVRGTIAMAKVGGDPNSATNQWFFNLDDNSANLDFQNGGFTAFGRVLGDGMAAVDALAAVQRYNFGEPFSSLPLRNAPVPLPNDFVVQPTNYLTLPSIARVKELVYTATSSDPSLVTAAFVVDGSGTNLRLDHAAGRSGSAVITVRAASIFDPTDVREDQFTVVREAATNAGAPSGVFAVPGNGLVKLGWVAPASSGDASITDYTVEYSTDGGSSWRTYADGVSTATQTLVTGLPNGTPHVFRVAAVTAVGTGAYSALTPSTAPRSVFAVGAATNARTAPVVRLVDAASGAQLAQATAFDPAFRGGARVAMGDLDGDGISELVAATGPGRVGEIRVFRQIVSGSTTTLAEIVACRTQPFGPRYTGGLELAVGDVDGDGREDLVAAMSRGAGTVSVFRSVNAADPVENTPYRTFTPFESTFDGGASVAVADVGTFAQGKLVSATAADKRVEIVVGSGAGMRSTVRVYDVSAAPRVVTTIQPFSSRQQGGVAVAAARCDADVIDDIVISSGRGGKSAIAVYDGRVDRAEPTLLVSSAAFAALARPNAPVYTAPLDLDGDGRTDRYGVTQGDVGGTKGILNVNTSGIRVGGLGSLRGPLRIAAPRTAARS